MIPQPRLTLYCTTQQTTTATREIDPKGIPTYYNCTDLPPPGRLGTECNQVHKFHRNLQVGISLECPPTQTSLSKVCAVYILQVLLLLMSAQTCLIQ